MRTRRGRGVLLDGQMDGRKGSRKQGAQARRSKSTVPETSLAHQTTGADTSNGLDKGTEEAMKGGSKLRNYHYSLGSNFLNAPLKA